MNKYCYYILPFLFSCSENVVTDENEKNEEESIVKQLPNIVIIYTDDMGVGDLSCYGYGYSNTPNIDRLASEGIRFNNYYSASPVSSPSRASIMTGTFPSELGINTFLQSVEGNINCEQFDYLDPSVPLLSRTLKEAGYTTAHIGKWHLGGGRDVKSAPSIAKYAFDEYVSTYESPDPDPKITAKNWIWSEEDEIKRWERTGYFVDKALDFMKRNKNKLCFVNLWPDDMHDPWIPSSEYYNEETYKSEETYKKVLDTYDREIGRFIQGLKDLNLWENTLLIFTSDNGALPIFDHKRTAGQRGCKMSLYEGGIRMPFIVCWPGKIKPNSIDNSTIVSSVDIYPSLCSIVGVNVPEECKYSGEDMSAAFWEGPQVRIKDLMWDYGRNKYFGFPGIKDTSPNLAIRRGDFKLLVNNDGTDIELYNIKTDPNETVNIFFQNKEFAQNLKNIVLDWYKNKRKIRT